MSPTSRPGNVPSLRMLRRDLTFAEFEMRRSVQDDIGITRNLHDGIGLRLLRPDNPARRGDGGETRPHRLDRIGEQAHQHVGQCAQPTTQRTRQSASRAIRPRRRPGAGATSPAPAGTASACIVSTQIGAMPPAGRPRRARWFPVPHLRQVARRDRLPDDAAHVVVLVRGHREQAVRIEPGGDADAHPRGGSSIRRSWRRRHAHRGTGTHGLVRVRQHRRQPEHARRGAQATARTSKYRVFELAIGGAGLRAKKRSMRLA